MKKYNNLYKCILFFAAFYYIAYCGSIMIELPYLTWFDQMPLVDKFYKGTLQLSDLFSKYGEHGMLANNILWLINVCYFHGSTLFDVALNDINVLICGIILAYNTKKIYGNWNVKTVGFITIEFVFMFGAMQSSCGAMETQVRLGILFFLIAMIFVDTTFHNNNSLWQYIVTIVMIFASINVFGTLYSFAGVPLIWGITVWYVIKEKQISKKNLLLSICYFMTIPIYIVEYRLWTILDKGGVFNLKPLLFIKGLFSYLANGALGWAYHESNLWNENFYLFIGAIILVMVVGAVVIFFRKKIYEKSWLPLMCITYSLGVYVMVYIGRADGWQWFANEWYNVHIKILYAAIICIYGYYILYCWESEKKFLAKLSVIGIVIVACLGILGNYCHIKRAPSVNQYYLEKQKYLFTSDENMMPLDDNGQTPLLESLDKTMNAISIMKKYNLSVYQYWNSYKECVTSPLDYDEIKWLKGRYDDGWVEKVSSFKLNTNDSSILDIYYYSLNNQNVRIKVNGEYIEEDININKGEGKIKVGVPQDSVITVELISDYSSQLNDNDLRNCSFIISDVVCVKMN